MFKDYFTVLVSNTGDLKVHKKENPKIQGGMQVQKTKKHNLKL
jgi:hypothetical protein